MLAVGLKGSAIGVHHFFSVSSIIRAAEKVVANTLKIVVIGKINNAFKAFYLHQEVNGLRLKGKSVHDICSTLCQAGGGVLTIYNYIYVYKKKMKCSGNSEILHEIVHDTTRKSEKHELICVVSRTCLCSISESPLNFISFL